MGTTREKLAVWLKYVIDDLKIHDRAGWGQALGVFETNIGLWIAGHVPRADKLRSILVLLRDRYPAASIEALTQWQELALLPLEGFNGDTLGRYALSPLWQDLKMAVESMPDSVGEELLKSFVAQTNALRLGGAR